ncbi:MAG: hypothetical protein NT027_01385 [Proteobacteria bacterium]|nr:hypothetical protein [Pseudomonadota bacterium]
MKKLRISKKSHSRISCKEMLAFHQHYETDWHWLSHILKINFYFGA